VTATTCDPAIDKILSKPDIASVLIVGVHTGKEAQRFIEAGKQVTGVDLLPYYRNGYTHIRSRFEDVKPGWQVDCAVSSHVLEHMENVGLALRKFQEVIKPGGWLGLVVPGYPQDEFFVGHLTLWSPALLLYNLVSIGWDCRDAEYYTAPDRKHIGVVVQNRRIPDMPDGKGWDIWGGLKTFLPVEFKHKMNAWLPDRWSAQE
jgi:SAM-dependent methyltransferase